MIHYIEGTNTILTDNFSRIQHLISSTQLANGKKLIDPVAVSDDEDADDAYFLDSELSGIIDNDINDALECFVNLLESYTPDQNLLSYDYILQKQQDYEKLLAFQVKYPNNYIYKSLDDDVEDILCYVRYNDDPSTQWIIALLESIIQETVKWFHIVMGHPGGKRLRESLQQRYHNHKLCHTIDKYKCQQCQRHKLSGKVYGILPEREIKISPWKEVAINFIGPWKVKFN